MDTQQTIAARAGGPGLSRRGFLGASGGLVVAFALFGPNAADAAVPARGCQPEPRVATSPRRRRISSMRGLR